MPPWHVRQFARRAGAHLPLGVEEQLQLLCSPESVDGDEHLAACAHGLRDELAKLGLVPPLAGADL
eukprot:scaffold45696_cov27-Tisochrysis_lutea.AAC.4